MHVAPKVSKGVRRVIHFGSDQFLMVGRKGRFASRLKHVWGGVAKSVGAESNVVGCSERRPASCFGLAEKLPNRIDKGFSTE